MKDRYGSVFTYQYDQQNRLTIQNVADTSGTTQQVKDIIGSAGILFDTRENYTKDKKTSSMTTQMDDLKRIISIQIQGTNGYSSNLQLNYDPNNRLTLLKVGEGITGAFSTQYKYIKSLLDKVQIDGQSALNDTEAANVKYTYYPNDREGTTVGGIGVAGGTMEQDMEVANAAVQAFAAVVGRK